MNLAMYGTPKLPSNAAITRVAATVSPRLTRNPVTYENERLLCPVNPCDTTGDISSCLKSDAVGCAHAEGWCYGRECKIGSDGWFVAGSSQENTNQQGFANLCGADNCGMIWDEVADAAAGSGGCAAGLSKTNDLQPLTSYLAGNIAITKAGNGWQLNITNTPSINVFGLEIWLNGTAQATVRSRPGVIKTFTCQNPMASVRGDSSVECKVGSLGSDPGPTTTWLLRENSTTRISEHEITAAVDAKWSFDLSNAVPTTNDTFAVCVYESFCQVNLQRPSNQLEQKYTVQANGSLAPGKAASYCTGIMCLINPASNDPGGNSSGNLGGTSSEQKKQNSNNPLAGIDWKTIGIVAAIVVGVGLIGYGIYKYKMSKQGNSGDNDAEMLAMLA